ncbi:MAG: HAMP domain-containing protein [Phycisphaerales bacterium]|jgi:two-component system, NarL family, sensor histidine kinase BarA|nr:HAMP domain-containing protein [Phycisphaerales bacterium]
MAKKTVTISLATKFRLLFGTAELGIIAVALIVPWYFMELMAQQGAQRAGAELTHLRLNEFIVDHASKAARPSRVEAIYSAGGTKQLRRGPSFIGLNTDLTPSVKLDFPAQDALKAFVRNVDQDLAVLDSEDESGRKLYRCFRAVRVTPTCGSCHGPEAPIKQQYQQGQLVGMIDVGVPTGADWLTWWTRVSFLVGGVLAGVVGSVLFAVIAQRIILRPIGHLRKVSDRAAEGSLEVRSHLSSGDELERLSDSFNQMLAAIAEQHGKLTSANEALDIKLSELAEVNVTLHRANVVKNEFLANVSHELRTPLNSILGFAGLLRESGDERIGRYGGNITLAAKNLLGMINDLLDIAKIEAGKAEVRFEKTSVSDICRTLLALMAPVADKNQITVESSVAGNLPMVVTDASKLQQILFNLLSNAMKFTPIGGTVKLMACSDASHSGASAVPGVVISVSDTGPGIPEAEQSRIFEKFYQVEASLTKAASGTGLGLAIAKELTGLIRGRLICKSSPGHGAEFTVFLPPDGAQAQKDSLAGNGI